MPVVVLPPGHEEQGGRDDPAGIEAQAHEARRAVGRERDGELAGDGSAVEQRQGLGQPPGGGRGPADTAVGGIEDEMRRGRIAQGGGQRRLAVPGGQGALQAGPAPAVPRCAVGMHLNATPIPTSSVRRLPMELANAPVCIASCLERLDEGNDRHTFTLCQP